MAKEEKLAADNSHNVGNEPDFGSNVYVFDPAMSKDEIESVCNSVFSKQERNRFGNERYALLFKPGSYNVSFNMGFYTQVSGLGESPGECHIDGGITVDAAWHHTNATLNFWRSMENLAINPAGGTMKWAVSQAAPMRRMHIKGSLVLSDQNGWSSGGFLADSIIDQTINPGTQQQWFTRNSICQEWTHGNWNKVFVGVKNAPKGEFPSQPYTVVDEAPILREKPYLYIDGAGKYHVKVPELQTKAIGVTWENGATAGQSIPIEQFYIANPENSDVASINSALQEGKHVLFTPGIYQLDDTIRVTQPDTVVLGLGLATLLPLHGQAAMKVDDVAGVKLAGLLFDAGTESSPVLLEVGHEGSSNNHSANPISLHDLFFRVGGAAIGRADVSLTINSNHVIGDHFWIWRADHGTGSKWDTNTTTNGLIVNGDNVTIYGLFCEHYHEHQTLWNGNGGQMFFYQCEIPYDPPAQEAWMSHGGTRNGYAAYKVSDEVTTHEAWGLGVYSYFRDAEVKLQNAIEVPETPKVKIQHATIVFLNGGGEITHVINNIGNRVYANSPRAAMVQTVTAYPKL